MKATEANTRTINLLEFASRQILAKALATDVAEMLHDAISERGMASLAVSGGSTPKLFFEALSETAIDWSKVLVTLVDDRVVPPDHDRSNEKLVYSHLLTNAALKAKFVPLWSDMSDKVETLAEHARSSIDHIARPFDVVVLGMGTDGHTASFFPEGSHLAEAIDPACKSSVLPMMAPGAGEPRLTLTLPRLVEARLLVLHIEGAEKQSVLTAACESGPAEDMPIRAVLENTSAPITVYWAA